jgi:hypothetical protein
VLVNNVTLVFLPTRAPAGEAVTAPNQQIYIDIVPIPIFVAPSRMIRLQSNAQGRIVGFPPGASAVNLDDSRDYHVVVSPTALPVPPTVAQGTTVRVSGGRLAVPPHIAIKLVQATGGAAASLACALKIGATSTNVSTTAAGWIMSNNKSAGEVMVRCDTRLLKTAAAATPAVTLAIAPTAPVRGSSATITATAPAGTAGFKVTEWKYDISHTNPATTTALTASVTRPATESPTTFDQNWQGDLCASGTVRMKFVTGAVVRASGDASVNATLTALDPVEVTLAVTVDPRTGPTWVTGLTEKPVGALVRPINSFHDTGQHEWTSGAWAVSAPRTPATGPNRGCQFLTSASVSFTSEPKINTLLSDAASAFSLAQDKAYLTSPTPVRVIPSHLYTKGAGGAITETSPGAVGAHFGITGSYMMSAHCIDQPTLLAGTRRHESEDPPPPAKSHKGNCLKALRALEPVKFAEALVKLPGGAALNFGQLFQDRLNLVAGVAATHDIVDEAQTRTDHAIRLIAGQAILGVNLNSSGALVGPAWNPTTNSELR